MGELRLPGIATGIDTTSLIKQLMTVQGRRLATYQVKQRNYDAQTSAIETLRSQIGSLRNSAGSLSDADDMEVYSVSTSDSDILTISASSDANPGSHSIEVDQLATAETWIQDVSSFSYTI